MDMQKYNKTIMLARFRRHSHGPMASTTGVFDELDTAFSGQIINLVNLDESELPVLGSVVSLADWLLITTSRVIMSREGKISWVMHTDIQYVDVDMTMCTIDRPLDTYQLSDIALETFSGRRWILHIQPGGGYLGILSVLKMIADQNWRTEI